MPHEDYTPPETEAERAARIRDWEATRDLSDVDQRTAQAVIDTIEKRYGVDPSAHRRHHDWVERRIRQCERVGELAWMLAREVLRWALLAALGGLAWAVWMAIKSQLST